MDLLGLNGYNLRGLDRYNVVLGKNGCGKSHLLRMCERALRNRQEEVGALRYLSPERGGQLQFDANIEQAITSNLTWLLDSRRQNQTSQFRQQSAVQFRRLELLTLREIEKVPEMRANPNITFDRATERINILLDRVRIERGDPGFTIHERSSGARVQPQDISSGESELISLGIECLVFEKECVENKINVLLVDSPDVHLHPDLQARFAQFVETMSGSGTLISLFATHSTALLGALASYDRTRVTFLHYGIRTWPSRRRVRHRRGSCRSSALTRFRTCSIRRPYCLLRGRMTKGSGSRLLGQDVVVFDYTRVLWAV